MKNKLDTTFQKLATKKQKALIAYLAAGYPQFAEQTRLIIEMEKSGVDILELGIPFSDPIADGPTIQMASQEALNNGASLKKILAWVRTLRAKVNLPIVFMSYINPLLHFGLKPFVQQAQAAGVSGVIIPDVIPEEAHAIQNVFNQYDLHLIYLVAPTSPESRIRRIAKQTSGFLYAVSVTGVTGARRDTSTKTKNWLSRVQSLSPVPVCVGFGISQPQHIRAYRSSVKGFIVGSALIDQIKSSSKKNRQKNVGLFIRQLAKECHHATH